MTATVPALACLAVALLLTGHPHRPSGRAAGQVAARDRKAAGRPAAGRPLSGRGPTVAAGASGIAVALLTGGLLGLLLGVMAAVAAHRGIGRLEPVEMRRERERREVEMPLTLDLLAVCLRAGMPLVGALEAVSRALAGPFRADLARVAGLLRLGSPPAAAWADLAGDADLAAVARAAGRSAESGSRLATSFERLAAERRAALASAGQATARKAGVVAMAPLGLCFLPAFVSLGLVPVVLSLATEVLP